MPRLQATGEFIPPWGSELYISSLSKEVSDADIRPIFESFGSIFQVPGVPPPGSTEPARHGLTVRAVEHAGGQIRIPKDLSTNEGKGFAFVQYYTKEEAEKALITLREDLVVMVCACLPRRTHAA